MREHQQVDSLAGVAPRWKDIQFCTIQSRLQADLYISGAQWLAQSGQKSDVECKSKSQPDWIQDKDESKNESLV